MLPKAPLPVVMESYKHKLPHCVYFDSQSESFCSLIADVIRVYQLLQ